MLRAPCYGTWGLGSWQLSHRTSPAGPGEPGHRAAGPATPTVFSFPSMSRRDCEAPRGLPGRALLEPSVHAPPNLSQHRPLPACPPHTVFSHHKQDRQNVSFLRGSLQKRPRCVADVPRRAMCRSHHGEGQVTQWPQHQPRAPVPPALQPEKLWFTSFTDWAFG